MAHLSSTSGRQSVNFASPLSSGTKWISFLFNMTGNNGADKCGVYFPNGGTGLFFGYGLAPISATQGKLGLGSMNTVGTAPQGATSLASSFTGTYGTTPYLVAMKIDFNTSGANDTVTVYINPTADAADAGRGGDLYGHHVRCGNDHRDWISKSGWWRSLLWRMRSASATPYADVVSDDGVVTPPSPVITDVSPSTGLTDGGTVVTITGSNFLAGATVNFGPNPGTGVSLTSSNSITATTPAGAPGAVNVVVANTNGLSATSFGGFTYVLPPLPPPVLVPGSVTLTGSNMNFEWLGATNTTSVLLTYHQSGTQHHLDPGGNQCLRSGRLVH